MSAYNKGQQASSKLFISSIFSVAESTCLGLVVMNLLCEKNSGPHGTHYSCMKYSGCASRRTEMKRTHPAAALQLRLNFKKIFPETSGWYFL